MSEFSELIKNFDKIRAYMRDFYIYGFKMRGDYTYKSARTYDNERRRIESWLSRYVRWDHSVRGKCVFISVDSARVAQNPLYAAWKSKSFTKSDMMLHFFLLDVFASGEHFSAEAITNEICARYDVIFDTQTVRGKLREYEKLGLVVTEKQGRSLFYKIREETLRTHSAYTALLHAVKFFQEAAPFGFIGSTILDTEQLQNDLFRFKHHFIVHTLDDSILQELLLAIAQKKSACIENRSRKTGEKFVIYGVPLRILTSTQSGRRYACLYKPDRRRFINVRLDNIVAVVPGEEIPYFDELQEKLDNNLPRCWGVSFGGKSRREQLFVKLHIDETREGYILERLRREGRGGELLRTAENTFLFSIDTFDTNEMLPWIKTFTGRILSMEGSNRQVVAKFYRDMGRMYEMYCGGEV